MSNTSIESSLKVSPSSQVEMTSFWKKLREFYQTGEKPKDSKDSGPLTSPARQFLDGSANKSENSSQNPLDLFCATIAKRAETNRSGFKSELKQLIQGVNKLLDPKATNDSDNETYHFASEIIAFEKVSGLLEKKNHGDLSEERLDRLKETISSLKSGLQFLEQTKATLLVDKTLQLEMPAAPDEKIELVTLDPDGAMQGYQGMVESRIRSVTDLVKAFRIAQLEVEGEYDENIHADYFGHFSWFRMTEKETTLFQPVCFVTSTEYLSDHLSELSAAISTNFPYKFWVLNDHSISKPQKEVSWEDASHRSRQELSSFVFSHRNCHLWQGSGWPEEELGQKILDSVNSFTPSLLHVLRTSLLEDDAWAKTVAASAGRFFPVISYNPQEKNRFDISSNIQPDKDWPVYELQHRMDEGTKKSLAVEFTYADYKALFDEKRRELLPIPKEFETDDLVPLNEYLRLKERDLYGKIPFIRLMNQHDEILKAAVPNVWVVSCQERYDFWLFLKSLAGGQKDETLVEKKDASPDATQVERKTTQEPDEESIKIAARRLIAVLLDNDDIAFARDQSNEGDSQVEKSDDKPEESTETISKQEAWLETEECTSCNECTDKYPHLFKYNTDKQAFITSPSNGKYEELVKAAEKCPAACIHPGLPIDSSEKNLDKLIKRAEKFN